MPVGGVVADARKSALRTIPPILLSVSLKRCDVTAPVEHYSRGRGIYRGSKVSKLRGTYETLTNWSNASPWYPLWTMAANLKAFQAFLHERQTGLVQRSQPWVKARQHTIGASEIAVLTGASHFDTPASLIRKKLHPINMSGNVACAWGRLFEPFARAYIEWYHATKVFGDTISLNLAKDHPLYGKVTCSPDGYFQALDGSIVLLEIKCPFTRKIVRHKIPVLYRDQVQTGLALSGDLVTKGLFVDCLLSHVLLVSARVELSTQCMPSWCYSQHPDPFPSRLGHLYSGE